MSSDDATDGGYVHEPGAVEADTDDAADDADTDGSTPPGVPGEPAPPAAEREFDWRGWVAVAAVFFAFVVAPAIVMFQPLVVPYRASLLALPMLPAVLLGLIAVWATTRK